MSERVPLGSGNVPPPFSTPSTPKDRKAWWGVHYVALLCDQAGFQLQETPPQGDVHSFDGQLYFRPGLPVSIQVKCTTARLARHKSYAIEQAWRTNWEGLVLPGYFVVVTVPSDVTGDWLQHGEDPRSTIARSAAYWTRIDPLMPAQKNIKVHASQRLTLETFKEWADDLQVATQSGFGGDVQ